MPESTVVVQLYGEGLTDVGPQSEKPTLPEKGVVTILVHKLCGSSSRLRFRSSHFPHLQGKNLSQKVRFAKRQSFYSRIPGVVFVMDSEGIFEVLADLTQGRDAELPDHPMAVGMAHRCIETWLLCDPNAIQIACSLKTAPDLPADPESIPAPQENRRHNPKTELKRICGAESSSQKTRIASQIKNLDLLRHKCPLGFAPFADEVEQRIKPLFD
jgi:hypothetical protein